MFIGIERLYAIHNHQFPKGIRNALQSADLLLSFCRIGQSVGRLYVQALPPIVYNEVYLQLLSLTFAVGVHGHDLKHPYINT